MGQNNIKAVDIILGTTSFFVVAIGGLAIGLVFGFIASVTTKYTAKTPVLEPLIILTISYLAYLTAEMTSTSSIIAYVNKKINSSFLFISLKTIFN